MVNTRLFILSTDTPFSRAKFYVDLDEVESLENIVQKIYDELMSIFEKHNFELLVSSLQKTNLHIHDSTFEDVLLSEPNKEFYICDHKH